MSVGYKTEIYGGRGERGWERLKFELLKPNSLTKVRFKHFEFYLKNTLSSSKFDYHANLL